MYVVKMDNEEAVRIMQMHAVARHITKGFSLRVPPEFGECFKYNKVHYSCLNDNPVTVGKILSQESLQNM